MTILHRCRLFSRLAGIGDVNRSLAQPYLRMQSANKTPRVHFYPRLRNYNELTLGLLYYVNLHYWVFSENPSFPPEAERIIRANA